MHKSQIKINRKLWRKKKSLMPLEIIVIKFEYSLNNWLLPCYLLILEIDWLPFMYEKWYVHNIFITFLLQILSGKLLLVVIIEVKKFSVSAK